jgi:hypothetical protein
MQRILECESARLNRLIEKQSASGMSPVNVVRSHAGKSQRTPQIHLRGVDAPPDELV